MPGNIKRMLDDLIRLRSEANPLVAITTKTKLILKGLDPDKFSPSSPDDAAIIAKIQSVAAEMGVYLR